MQNFFETELLLKWMDCIREENLELKVFSFGKDSDCQKIFGVNRNHARKIRRSETIEISKAKEYFFNILDLCIEKKLSFSGKCFVLARQCFSECNALALKQAAKLYIIGFETNKLFTTLGLVVSRIFDGIHQLCKNHSDDKARPLIYLKYILEKISKDINAPTIRMNISQDFSVHLLNSIMESQKIQLPDPEYSFILHEIKGRSSPSLEIKILHEQRDFDNIVNEMEKSVTRLSKEIRSIELSIKLLKNSNRPRPF